MRKLITIFVITTLFITGCKDHKPEFVLKVLNEVKRNYDRHHSIKYKINYKHKSFDDVDTLQLIATCKLAREKTNKLFGGEIWFITTDNIDSVERYYDLSNVYIIEHSIKKITEYGSNENQSSPITGNISGDMINIHFINTDELVSGIMKNAKTAALDSVKNHFIITIKHNDKNFFSEMETKIWIQKPEYVIDKMTFNARFQGNYQYTEWNLSDIEFDNVKFDKMDILLKTQYQSYIVEQYLYPIEEENNLLKNGIAAPVFSGIDFMKGKEISLKDYKDKYIILDFSYMSCMPCLKAIPELIQIQKEYKNKNVIVLAINSKDCDDKRKKRLPDFIKKNAMNYPIILTSSKTDSVYNVKAYPSLYVIDKKGVIIFSQIGYSDKLSETLKTLINNQMK